MKFTCQKSDLIEALQIVSRAVAVKPQLPILSGVYMNAEGSTLELQGNNFSLGVIAKISANTEVGGEMVVTGKYLLEIVRKLPGDLVTIFRPDDDPSKCMIESGSESGSVSFDLLAMNATDFPKVKTQETFNSFKIKSAELKKVIRKTAFACSSEEVRPIFTGCLFDIEGENLNIAATNTHRLAVVKGKVFDNGESFKFVIPASTLRDLMRILDSANENSNVQVESSHKYIAFTFDNIFMTSRLIEGEFPPYDRVIPSDRTTTVTANIAEVLAAVDRVSVISKETEYNTIRFIMSQEGIKISSNSPDVGHVEENISATIEGEELDISFNELYISDVLKAMDGEEFKVYLTEPLKPADFREVDNDDFIYVVTPVRTN